MVRMRVIEADDIFSALAPLTLDAHQFFWIDVVAVVRGVSASIATTGSAGHCSAAIVCKLPEQHTAAFVRISLLAMFANSIVIRLVEFQHFGFALSAGNSSSTTLSG